MPSKYKTSYLNLNSYVGTDKPRMDDFNADNQLIDKAMQQQSDKIENIAKHSSDITSHISAQERQNWNNLIWEVGTYIGDGNYLQKVEIGFKPSLGFIFQKDEFLISSIGMSGEPQTEQRAGIITPQGCSLYCKILDNGFMVCHSNDIAEDCRMPKLNTKDQTYVYIMFR